jgi:hypothetical protein
MLFYPRLATSSTVKATASFFFAEKLHLIAGLNMTVPQN